MHNKTKLRTPFDRARQVLLFELGGLLLITPPFVWLSGLPAMDSLGLLAVIAYGCVGFAIVALLPPGSLGDAVPAGDRGWAGGFALAGLVAALGAWAFARAMARGRAEHDADGGD